MFTPRTRMFAGLLTAGLAATAVLAQDATVGVENAPESSPLAFARSQAKAAAAEAAAKAAEASGGRVIGGEVAAEGAWPWQVALMVAGAPVEPNAQFCGGTMILDQWVLTAAHCVEEPNANGEFSVVTPDNFEVFIGSNVLRAGTGDKIAVQAIFMHPDYDRKAFNNDIALVKLARSPNVPFKTIQVPTAELGTIIDQPGVPSLVTGWGLIDGMVRPEEMRQGKIEILPRDQCNGFMIDLRAKFAAKGFSEAVDVFGLKEADAQQAWKMLIDLAPLPLSENMLCSGTYEGGRTSCSGDSGGPLVVPMSDGSYVQAGVVSWGLSNSTGRGCNEKAQFSAYTKVSNYVPWLEQTIANN